MAEVKWIKITLDIFEDEKINYICSLPEADAIIVIWFRLLTLAGKCNAGGFVFLTENIPYNEDMLAHKCNKPISVIQFALEIFKRLHMIEFIDDTIFLPNWTKHQNIEGMDKIRQQNRLRQKRRREKALLQIEEKNEYTLSRDMSRDSNVTVTQSHADRIKNKNKEIDIEDNINLSVSHNHLKTTIDTAKDGMTDGITKESEIINKILLRSQIHLYPADIANEIKKAVRNLYFDEKFSESNLKRPLSMVRQHLENLEISMIDLAINKMQTAIEKGTHIKSRTKYLQSCIFNAIEESISTKLLNNISQFVKDTEGGTSYGKES